MHEQRWNARRAHEEIQEELRHQHWLLHKILERNDTMSAELDRLTTEVEETKGAVASATALIQGLADFIRNNASDPAALKRMADSLDADQASIGEAMAANPLPGEVIVPPAEPPVEPVP